MGFKLFMIELTLQHVEEDNKIRISRGQLHEPVLLRLLMCLTKATLRNQTQNRVQVERKEVCRQGAQGTEDGEGSCREEGVWGTVGGWARILAAQPLFKR